MASSIGDDIARDGSPVPDVPQTALAFRTWRIDDANGRLLSINPPAVTGKAGSGGGTQRIGWITRQLADKEGQNGWPIGGPLIALCGARKGMSLTDDENGENDDHGRIPSENCTCGIYATTEIRVINKYLGNEVVNGQALRGPVLGVVEMGGKVIPATQGFRAEYARIAAILIIDEVFSLSESRLKAIAEFYKVPAIRAHSLDPEDYREDIQGMPQVNNMSAIGDEAEQWLLDLSKPEDGDEGGE